MKFARSYKKLLEARQRYAVVYGGAGSGKSEHVARKLLIRSLQEGGHNWLVVRKYATTLKDSVWATIKNAIKENNLPFIEKTQMRKIWFYDNAFNFYGLDDPEKIKSIKGITGIWVEEASELTKEDFIQLDLRLRGETKNYKQIVLTFNPVHSARWIREMFIDVKRDDTFVLHTTVKDNPFIDAEYIRTLENIADEQYRKVYLLGEWEKQIAQVFSNYVVVEPENWEFDYYGLDFGFNNPTALVCVKEKEDGWVVQELLYRRGMTQEDLKEKLLELIPNKAQIFCDSAEPARIEDLKRAGLNAIAGDKKVVDGILYLKSKKLYVSGANLVKEIQKYSWESRWGIIFDKPVKVDDHLIDAMRYAIYTKYTLQNNFVNETALLKLNAWGYE